MSTADTKPTAGAGWQKIEQPTRTQPKRGQAKKNSVGVSSTITNTEPVSKPNQTATAQVKEEKQPQSQTQTTQDQSTPQPQSSPKPRQTLSQQHKRTARSGPDPQQIKEWMENPNNNPVSQLNVWADKSQIVKPKAKFLALEGVIQWCQVTITLKVGGWVRCFCRWGEVLGSNFTEFFFRDQRPEFTITIKHLSLN